MLRLPATLEIGYNFRVTIPLNVCKLLEISKSLINIRVSRIDNLSAGYNIVVSTDSQNRITIPKAIRNRINVGIGDNVVVVVEGKIEETQHE